MKFCISFLHLTGVAILGAVTGHMVGVVLKYIINSLGV